MKIGNKARKYWKKACSIEARNHIFLAETPEQIRAILVREAMPSPSEMPGVVAAVQSIPEPEILELKTRARAYSDDSPVVLAQRQAFEREREEQQSLEDARSKWPEFLSAAGVNDPEIAGILKGALDDPRQAAQEWLREAESALLSNKKTNGLIWQKWLENGFLEYRDVAMAITAYRRHTRSDYDELLRLGMSRDQAREHISLFLIG